MKHELRKTELTKQDVELIAKYQRASENFKNLKDMDKNSMFMASTMPKLLKVIKKYKTILKEREAEIQTIKDATEKMLRDKINEGRQEKIKRTQHWKRHHGTDAIDL